MTGQSFNESMWQDRVSNLGPLALESDILWIALLSPAGCDHKNWFQPRVVLAIQGEFLYKVTSMEF